MPRVRDAAAALVTSAPSRFALRMLEAADRGRTDRCLVLTYHRIDHEAARPHLWPGLLSATPDEFGHHMEFVARRMRPLTMAELLTGIREGHFPRRSVLITIDDAYLDVAEHAWPTLRRLEVPATLFVPTSFIDTGSGFWWDRLYHAIRATHRSTLPWRGSTLSLADRHERETARARTHAETREALHADAMRFVAELEAAAEVHPPPRGVLEWSAIATMSADGLELGAHTRTHPRLDRVDRATAVEEIRGSMDDLLARIGPAVRPVLAYPSGDHGSPAIAAAREAGVEAAFTTRRGAIDMRGLDPLRLGRVNVGRRSTVDVLRVQAGSWMRMIGR